MLILTKRQKLFLKEFSKQGYFTLKDLQLFYATQPSRKEFLMRLGSANLIKDLGNSKFQIINYNNEEEGN